ncbi:hypothetical protein EJO68_04185 [Variovorax atrisoli]|uniref:hypothetical protein n=1 Tax=Variovorax atrisoli TaxID=3394203 RepID=UPI000F7D7A15|nr:hypothetical protein [Variovorax sp. 369]RTD98578.1 hypothetical protein EJO68_04185 [Variovorax sp. 369]
MKKDRFDTDEPRRVRWSDVESSPLLTPHAQALARCATLEIRVYRLEGVWRLKGGPASIDLRAADISAVTWDELYGAPPRADAGIAHWKQTRPAHRKTPI